MYLNPVTGPLTAFRDVMTGQPIYWTGWMLSLTISVGVALFALAALGGTAWMWWQDQSSLGLEQERVFSEIARLESRDSELSLKLDQLRGEVDETASGDISGEFEALQRRLRADRAKLADPRAEAARLLNG